MTAIAVTSVHVAHEQQKTSLKLTEGYASPASLPSHRKAATMSDDRVELKPCPKCRRVPCIETYALYQNSGYIECNCGVTFNGHHGDDIVKLTKRWNTRTLDPSIESLQAEVKRLRTLVRNYVDPFDVTPADHAVVLALGTDDEEGYRQALAAKEQTR